MRASIVVLAAIGLLGCKANNANEANASGNGVVNSAETRTDPATPLTHDQAVALMKERHDHMEALGKAAKKAGGTLKSGSPDVTIVKESAAQMNELAPKLLTWFPPGTGADVGKTRAKPEIWQKPEDFALKARDFEKAASDFNDAAQSGDLTWINTAFGTVGKSCKACHDLYRAPEKD